MFYVDVNHKRREAGRSDQPAMGQQQRSGPFATREEAERFARSIATTTPIWGAEIVEALPDDAARRG